MRVGEHNFIGTEAGQELIFDPARGAHLVPFGKGLRVLLELANAEQFSP
jgi:hypothetical protein